MLSLSSVGIKVSSLNARKGGLILNGKRLGGDMRLRDAGIEASTTVRWSAASRPAPLPALRLIHHGRAKALRKRS